MTDQEIEEFVKHSPVLYHMAERGSWDAIKKYGLLSTTALLDLYRYNGKERRKLEECHRPCKNTLEGFHLPNGDYLPDAVIRDQGALSTKKLRQCLLDGLTPSDWYQILNKKVFFWVKKNRLNGFTFAKRYRDREHDVLELCTRSLIKAHESKISFCRINSGSTLFPPYKERGKNTFLPIARYLPDEDDEDDKVIELTVDYAVPDIEKHIRRVVVMKNKEIVSIVHQSRTLK